MNPEAIRRSPDYSSRLRLGESIGARVGPTRLQLLGMTVQMVNVRQQTRGNNERNLINKQPPGFDELFGR
jgi:hypothetical protein